MKKVLKEFMSLVIMGSSFCCVSMNAAHANSVITKPKSVKPHFSSVEKLKIFNLLPGSYSSSVRSILHSQGWKVSMTLNSISAYANGMKFSGEMDGSEFHRIIGFRFEGNSPELKAQSARLVRELGAPSIVRNGQMIWGGDQCSRKSPRSCIVLEKKGDFMKITSFYKINLPNAKQSVTTKVINGIEVKFHN